MSADRVQESIYRWLSFVQAFVAAYELGVRLSGGQDLEPTHTACPSDFPTLSRPHKSPLVILCSPHPDDEMLTGVLPLRMLREQGARVINLSMTLGSSAARQAERWVELQEACAVVGFDCQRLRTPLAFDLKAGAELELILVPGRAWWRPCGGDTSGERRPTVCLKDTSKRDPCQASS